MSRADFPLCRRPDADWRDLPAAGEGRGRAASLCAFCRNKDFREVTLEKSGEVLLRFAAAYGFRNLQNVVLKLKKGRLPFHFVEVLACAGGKAPPQSLGKRAPPCPP